MIFSFSLCAATYKSILVAYFRSRMGKLESGKLLEGGKMCCVITNTGREMLVLVDFQDDYYSVSYQIIY